MVLASLVCAALGQREIPTHFAKVGRLVANSQIVGDLLGELSEIEQDQELGEATTALILPELLTVIDLHAMRRPSFREATNLGYSWDSYIRGLGRLYFKNRAADRSMRRQIMLLLLVSHIPIPGSDVGLSPFPRKANLPKQTTGVLEPGDYYDLVTELRPAVRTEREMAYIHLYDLYYGDLTKRLRSLMALGRVHDGAADEVLPHLLRSLSDKESRVVQEAISAVGALGHLAKETIPHLEKLISHGDEQIAKRALVVLKQMRK